MREKIAEFMASAMVRNTIIGVIIFNAIILGLETSPAVMSRFGGLLHLLDKICLWIFVTEIALKLYAHRFAFFRNGWNLFDFIIVGIALAPASEGFSVLRALRILRVMRVMSAAPSLRRVVEGFITALPGMGSVFMLSLIHI